MKVIGPLKNIFFKIAIPIVIGLATIFFLFNKEFSFEVLGSITLSADYSYAFLFILISIWLREWGMALRFRFLTNLKLTWKQIWRTVFLCEFTSAITPSSVGGSALSMVFLNKEGINAGKSTTLTLVILFLDNLFFVLTAPLIFIFFKSTELFQFLDTDYDFGTELIFWVAYGVMVLVAAFLFISIFFLPYRIHIILNRIFRLKILSRWQSQIDMLGRNMIEASQATKNSKFSWWLRSFIATVISWTGRFLVVNSLFILFIPHINQGLIFARQYIIWALLMFSPTPGGSGVSEWLFDEYYSDLVSDAGTLMVIAILWRVFTYYIYLIAGCFLLPSFLKNKSDNNSNN